LRVGIVGGGPAGAMLALRLARGGLRPTLFHDPEAGEKPCGGGITAKAFSEFPELRELAIPRTRVDRFRVVAPSGREASIEREGMFEVFCRADLDGALRRAAVEAGARLVPARVRSVAPGRPGRVEFDGEESEFDFVVGADGARSVVGRSVGAALPNPRLCPSVGILVRGVDPAAGATIRFFRGIRGYLWVFPGPSRASIGIVARPGDAPASALRARVEEFRSRVLPNTEVVGSYGWMIPAPGPDGRPPVPVSGEGYALLGDAAGLVDPITGEGIYWAFLSAALLARAVLEGRPEHYREGVEEGIMPDLRPAGVWAERSFRAWVLEAVLVAAARSRRVRGLIADLASGEQRYATLPDRIRRRRVGRLLTPLLRVAFGGREITSARR